MFIFARSNKRKGNIIPLMAVTLPAFAIFIAYMIEVSRLHYVKNQLQTAADAGALAGAAHLRHTDTSLISFSYSLEGTGIDKIRPSVKTLVSANSAAHLGPQEASSLFVDENLSNSSDGDIVLGKYGSQGEFNPVVVDVNAVKVIAQFGFGHTNGQLPLFFGRLLPMNAVNLRASAIARVERPLLVPFLIFEPQWQSLAQGVGSDLFSVDIATNAVTLGSDGVLETIVLPGDWDGLVLPPGNFGWFDLSPNTGTDVLCRLLAEGPNATDLAMFGGRIEAGDYVSGVTGIKAGTEAAIVGGDYNGLNYQGIIGKPRVIALYDQASGQGTNALFRITKFVLARIVSADLSASPKAVVVQPITSKDNPNRVQLVR